MLRVQFADKYETHVSTTCFDVTAERERETGVTLTRSDCAIFNRVHTGASTLENRRNIINVDLDRSRNESYAWIEDLVEFFSQFDKWFIREDKMYFILFAESTISLSNDLTNNNRISKGLVPSRPSGFRPADPSRWFLFPFASLLLFFLISHRALFSLSLFLSFSLSSPFLLSFSLLTHSVALFPSLYLTLSRCRFSLSLCQVRGRNGKCK